MADSGKDDAAFQLHIKNTENSPNTQNTSHAAFETQPPRDTSAHIAVDDTGSTILPSASATLQTDDDCLGTLTAIFADATYSIDDALDQLTTSTDLFDVPTLSVDTLTGSGGDQDGHG
jgi:hypothetical protein